VFHPLSLGGVRARRERGDEGEEEREHGSGVELDGCAREHVFVEWAFGRAIAEKCGGDARTN